MSHTSLVSWFHQKPTVSLVLLFISWKLLLLLLACTSPYPGYDTSTTLLLSTESRNGDDQNILVTALERLAGKLTRWDAIYFSQIAHRGAVFEQEWAFGWGFARLLHVMNRVMLGRQAEVVHAAIAGIFLSTISHLLSVLVLYNMTLVVAARPTRTQCTRIAFVSACLHIISPAGLFLSAPCAESSFALLNFSGYYLYALGLQADHDGRANARDAMVVLSGLLFGVSATFRSNGLLNGLIFCLDLVRCAVDYLHFGHFVRHLRRSISVVVAGSLLGAGFLYPQYLAYQEFCSGSESKDWPPWCSNRIPSIYTWVQDHYWNVGFLRYWTFSNAPLFLLAAPMLFILISSGLWSWASKTNAGKPRIDNAKMSNDPADDPWMSPVGMALTSRLAVPQLVLSVLALTTYHVQVITRISSGYPVWYWWLASSIVCQKPLRLGRRSIPTKSVVKWMVLYALIQGGLFAAFLPPA